MSNPHPPGRVAGTGGREEVSASEYNDLIARSAWLMRKDEGARLAWIAMWKAALGKGEQVSNASLSEWADEHGRKHGTAGQRG